MIYYPPPRLEVCSRVTFVCLYCILPLCFAPLLAGNLYPFDVMTSSSQVCYHAESGGEEGIGCRCDVLYRLLWWGCAIACVCVCVCAETRDWKGESSNPACPGQLPSKRREHSRTIVFCQRNKHRICIVNFWLSLPPQKKKIPMNSPMNPNLKLFHGGTTSWLEQILCSKQSGQGKL